MTIPEQAIEAAAERAYLNNRAGETPWIDLSERHKQDWRIKVTSVLEAAASHMGVQRPEDVARAFEEAREFVRNLWRNKALREREHYDLIALIDTAEKLALRPHTGQPQEGYGRVLRLFLDQTTCNEPECARTSQCNTVRGQICPNELRADVRRALSAAPASPRAEGEPQTSIEYHRQRGAAWDIVDEALIAYREFMLDDDYDATTALKKICDRMEERRALYHPAPPVIAEKQTP